MVSFWPIICLLLEPFGLLNCDDPSIFELRANTFDKFLSDNEFVMVEFYTPWCQHCKTFRPEYSKLSNTLQMLESKIKLAKVNVAEQKELGDQNGIKSYPTLKLFINGKPFEYRGKRTTPEINSWMARKIDPIDILETVEDIQTLVDDSEISVIGFFANSNAKQVEIFKNAAQEDDSNIQFAMVASEKLLKDYGVEKNQVILYKEFDDNKTIFELEFNVENLKVFFTSMSRPLLIDFQIETASQLFQNSDQNNLFVFTSKGDQIYNNIENDLRDLSKKWREKFQFIIVNMDRSENLKLTKLFTVDSNEIPTYRIIRFDEGISKYKPADTKLNIDGVTQFLAEFMDGKIKQHLLSQELPADWNAKPVKVLVSSNFEEIVFDVEKDVLVEFYSPHCGHCKHMEKAYNQLGEYFKDSETVVIAKMDSTLNELAHIKVRSFPTIKLYKRGDNQIKDYNGSRTLESFIAFVEETQNKTKPVVNDEL